MKYFILIFIYITLANCAENKKTNQTPNIYEPSDSIKLQDIWGLDSWTNQPKENITLEIFTNSAKIQGEATCNSYFAGLKLNVKQKKIAFTKIISTKRMCKLINAETLYFKQMAKINAYKLENNFLKLYSNDTLYFQFKKID